MWWILFIVVQVAVILSGIRKEQSLGLWSWSKFAFTVAFGILEAGLILIPAFCIEFKSPWFAPVMSGAGIIAGLNVIWLIIVMRRWKLPDGRTSLQAYRDVYGKK